MTGAFKLPREPLWVVVRGKQGAEWREFTIIVLLRNERHHYQLSHNGQRFCRDNSLRVLCDEWPTVAEEVCEWAEAV